jgi:hypothetical protein
MDLENLTQWVDRVGSRMSHSNHPKGNWQDVQQAFFIRINGAEEILRHESIEWHDVERDEIEDRRG